MFLVLLVVAIAAWGLYYTKRHPCLQYRTYQAHRESKYNPGATFTAVECVRRKTLIYSNHYKG